MPPPRPRSEELQRTVDVRAAKRMPAAARVHDRVLAPRERANSSAVELGVTDRELPVELRDRARREKAARPLPACAAVRFARIRVGALHPGLRQHHRHAARLELRHQRAQEERRVLCVQLDLGRLVGIELDPVPGEERPELRRALRKSP